MRVIDVLSMPAYRQCNNCRCPMDDNGDVIKDCQPYLILANPILCNQCTEKGITLDNPPLYQKWMALNKG